MEPLLPIRRRASQHPRRANRSPRGTRPSCTLTARPCAASQKAASTPLTNHKKNPQPRFNRNQQYSITAVSDGGGSVVERYAYSAYGQVTITDASGSVISNSAISNRYTYTGREWDEGLSLYHYRARMYDAVGGRFVSRDPLGYVDGKSLYKIYISLMETDPTGNCVPELTPVECCKIAFSDPKIWNPDGISKKPAGMVICCNRKKVSCAQRSGPPEEEQGRIIANKCTLKHEDLHRNEQPGRSCDESPERIWRPTAPDGADLNKMECAAHKVSLACILSSIGECNGDGVCIRFLKEVAFKHYMELKTRRCRSTYGTEYPNDWRNSFPANS
jgi:RHS repeat-associated protein